MASTECSSSTASSPRASGVDVDKIFVLENGQVVEYDGERARMAGSVTAGAVLVDGIAAIDGIDGVVLRDRRMLASDGVVMVALTVDGSTGQPVGMPTREPGLPLRSG
jgi:ribonuclease J